MELRFGRDRGRGHARGRRGRRLAAAAARRRRADRRPRRGQDHVRPGRRAGLGVEDAGRVARPSRWSRSTWRPAPDRARRRLPARPRPGRRGPRARRAGRAATACCWSNGATRSRTCCPTTGSGWSSPTEDAGRRTTTRAGSRSRRGRAWAALGRGLEARVRCRGGVRRDRRRHRDVHAADDRGARHRARQILARTQRRRGGAARSRSTPALAPSARLDRRRPRRRSAGSRWGSARACSPVSASASRRRRPSRRSLNGCRSSGIPQPRRARVRRSGTRTGDRAR